jgi:hypothetical protein
MNGKNELVVWRDSVCAGDDCDAPHEMRMPVRGESLRTITARLLEAHYPASISGGRATWILQPSENSDRSLAVIAQQWPEPRFLVLADEDVFAYVRQDSKPHLYLRYWCQVDPEWVFTCLLRGEPLPDRYGR